MATCSTARPELSREAGFDSYAMVRCMQQLNRVRSFPTWRTAHQERAHDGRFNNIDDSALSERLTSPALSRNEQKLFAVTRGASSRRSAKCRDALLRPGPVHLGASPSSRPGQSSAAPLNRNATAGLMFAEGRISCP